MPVDIDVSWSMVSTAVDAICDRWADSLVAGVYGVPTGGAPPAVMVASRLQVPLLETPERGCLVVDDLVDSGATAARFTGEYRFDACFRKPGSPPDVAADAVVLDGWLRFPWENHDGAPEDAVVRLLQWVGEDPGRDGLRDTPGRVVRALRDLCGGYTIDPAVVLDRCFDVAHDEMIVVRRVPFHSLCEHHLLPFTGHATVAYIPNERLVGLSKLARVVDLFARRLQVQERLTNQIADAIDEHLDPAGVGVIVTAVHSCMAHRGIQKHAEMVTSSVRGAMREDPSARHELLALHKP